MTLNSSSFFFSNANQSHQPDLNLPSPLNGPQTQTRASNNSVYNMRHNGQRVFVDHININNSGSSSPPSNGNQMIYRLGGGLI